jgi:hypothetical protein
MKFYRFEFVNYAELNGDGEFISPKIPNPKLVKTEYSLVKETEKGYWICLGDITRLHGHKRWVSKTAKKRHAYPTEEEALNGFIKRTEKRIKILKHQLDCCAIAVSLAKSKFN